MAIDKVRSAPWMHGANDRGWRVSFDFLLKPDNFAKVMEGAYDQREGSRRSRAEQTRDALAELADEARNG